MCAQQTITGWLERWTWSAKHLLHVYQTFFKSGYPFSDQALVDTARRLNPDPSTRSLVDHLLQFRGELLYARHRTSKKSDGCVPSDGVTGSLVYGDNGAKSEDDFNYELFWVRELFKEH